MSISVKYLHLHYTHLTKFTFSFLQTALVPLLHSLVPTSAVCLQHGAVMATMTALITAMNTTVLHGYLERVPQISSLVPTTTASLIPGAATQTMTVGTVRMKLTVVSIPQRVHHLERDTQLHRSLNVMTGGLFKLRYLFKVQVNVTHILYCSKKPSIAFHYSSKLLSCNLRQSEAARATQDSSSVQTTAA